MVTSVSFAIHMANIYYISLLKTSFAYYFFATADLFYTKFYFLKFKTDGQAFWKEESGHFGGNVEIIH